MCSAAAAVLLMAMPRAMAACSADVSGSPSPDTFNCTGSDTDGENVTSTDSAGINITIAPNAMVSDNNFFNTSVGAAVFGTNLSFSMPDANSSITGDETWSE
ncbi:hypothetical protein [Hyphomicrobium sp. NDB2Meth4]|uniref:hypothetical protein n=1 Tax=Hyphomicrobium sp. NDB2Meth4 TaxID=1892846 RepID=UPI0009312712|nr:hypothetical protein [Hyphomicrobium sp. NDB2Meth4]